MSSHYNRQSNNNTYQHRGALTKLKSSTPSSSVGSFHTIGAGNSTSGVGRLGGVANKALGAGLAVGRNVPKLVNTSSLRKENGGQDITAVLVNRDGEYDMTEHTVLYIYFFLSSFFEIIIVVVMITYLFHNVSFS